jgi:predicted O-linked N-acetylglucosamine transferase (SPINDLY family)
MTSAQELVAAAWQHYQGGRRNEAIDCLKAAIRLSPDVPEAHNNLGTLLAQEGRLVEAVACFQEAVRVKPDYVDARNNLANALRGQAEIYFKQGIALTQQGNYEEAAASYQASLQLQPNSAGAHNNLGNVFLRQGKLADATQSFRLALRCQPDFVAAKSNLGEALRQQGRLEEAVACFEEALRNNPHYADAHNNLALALEAQGKLNEAVASHRQAVQCGPDHPHLHYNLGNALMQQANLKEAVVHLRHAVRLKPDYVEALCNLGVVLGKQGLTDLALEQYQAVLRIDPDHAETHLNLGVLLGDKGELLQAEASLQRALGAKPGFVDASFNLATVVWKQGRCDEAEALYRELIRLKPQHVDAHMNLGALLKDQGRLDEALDIFRAILRIKPEASLIHSNLIYTLNYHPGYDCMAIREECARWNSIHAEPLKPEIRPHPNAADPERRIRIGYVSPDFRQHVDALFLVPLLSNHDHARYEIFCYANVTHPDAMTKRLRNYADVWRSAIGMSDQQVAELVRSDQIDILVDLKMHTANNQLLVFARKPAPVQVAWLGYPGTTGLSTMDYRLTDRYMDSPGRHDACYSEESIRLPDCFWCYDGSTSQVPVGSLPALESGLFTFGCLNTFCKINEGCLSLWEDVLRRVANSRLLLRAPRGQIRDSVIGRFQRDKIAEGRIELVETMPRAEYLAMHHRIDLGLDPSPYNGHTTSLDAFWMGVPTLTLVGKTVVGRAGYSQLCNLGLSELAAETPAEFVELAARWANDLQGLQELRGSLRQRMQRSPLMDGKRFTRNVEEAYRHMWARWCQRRESSPAN